MNNGRYGTVLGPRIYEYVLAGLLLAVAAGGVVGYHVYHGFVTEEIGRDQAYWGIGLPFVGLAGGIYIFAYGWQRGDVQKALRMAMWLSLGAVGIIAAVLAVLSLKQGGRSGLGLFGFGRTGYRRRHTGWQFGNTEDSYEYGSPWLGGSVFGDSDDNEPKGPRELTVHCRGCGNIFTPHPPDARCPSCGLSILDRAG